MKTLERAEQMGLAHPAARQRSCGFHGGPLGTRSWYGIAHGATFTAFMVIDHATKVARRRLEEVASH